MIRPDGRFQVSDGGREGSGCVAGFLLRTQDLTKQEISLPDEARGRIGLGALLPKPQRAFGVGLCVRPASQPYQYLGAPIVEERREIERVGA